MCKELSMLLGISGSRIEVKQKIPKVQLLKNLDLNVGQKRLINDEIDALSIFGVLNTDTSSIPAYKDDEMYFEEILFISVVLRTDKHASEIIELLHRSVPNHIVLGLVFDKLFMLSVAEKRLHKVEEGRQVLEQIYKTPRLSFIGGTKNEERFLSGLGYKEFPLKNLESWYRGVSKYVFQSALLSMLPEWKYNNAISISQLMPLVNSYLEAEAKHLALVEEEKKTINFAEKMEVRKRLQVTTGLLEQKREELQVPLT